MKIHTIPVGILAANCQILIDEETMEAAIIDPGDEAEKIEQIIKSTEAKPTMILLTHGHPDHSFAAGELQETFDVDVRMHEADVPQFECYPDLVAMFYNPDSYVKPRLGEFLNDGDSIKVGNEVVEVIHTPGHSPGGLCFKAGSSVIVGDTLFAGGIGRTDLHGGSYEDLINSIKEKLLILPEETVIYPGHGPTSSIGLEREDNPYIGEDI